MFRCHGMWYIVEPCNKSSNPNPSPIPVVPNYPVLSKAKDNCDFFPDLKVTKSGSKKKAHMWGFNVLQKFH